MAHNHIYGGNYECNLFLYYFVTREVLIIWSKQNLDMHDGECLCSVKQRWKKHSLHSHIFIWQLLFCNIHYLGVLL